MQNPHTPHRRPPWWPENASWPPKRGGFRPNRFFRRVGCFFLVFNLLVSAIFILLATVIAKILGLADLTVLLQWALPLGLVALAFIIVVIVFAMMALHRISVPFDDLLEAAGHVAEGDYSRRVQEKGPPEVRSLIRAFNNMASRLNQVDEQRRNLLADATHELRTPLTVIQGNLEGMLDNVYPADENNLRALLEETHILSRLIDDLRTLALAESGALQLKKEPIEPLPFLQEIVSIFQTQAASSGVIITTQVADNLPLLDIDPIRMQQVLANLLSNALYYTPAGGTIRLTCELDNGNIQLSVQDDGPGIREEDLPHIFERFYKSTDSGGMGLGLAIAKHLIEAHGGRITAENGPNRGTIIIIQLPVETESA